MSDLVENPEDRFPDAAEVMTLLRSSMLAVSDT